MSYVNRLRERVGNEPLLLVRTAITVLDRRGRILLVEQAGGEGWTIPGGYMETGETAEEAGRREVMQKTGMKIGELSLLGVFSGERYYHVTDAGEAVYPVILNFLTKEIVELVDMLDGATHAKFFPLDQLPADVQPIVEETIQHYGPSFF